jgi:hypothetical protein
MKAKSQTTILLLIILLAIIIRVLPFPGLTRGPISFDSGMTLANAANSLIDGTIFKSISPDQAPLRYIILHFFLYFGREESVITFPSLIFGILSIYFIYVLGKNIFNSNVGILSSFLLAFSPWHIHHSCYTAMYTLYIFLSILSLLFFLKLTETKEKLKVCFPYVIFSILMFYSFYPTVTIILAEFFYFFLCLEYNKEKKIAYLNSLLIIGIFIIPGLFRALEGFKWKMGYTGFAWGWNNSDIINNLFSTFGGLNKFLPVNILFFLSGFIIALLDKSYRKQSILLFLCTVFPILFFLFSFMFKMNVTSRYFIFAYPFFVILSSVAILKSGLKIIRLLFIVTFNLSFILFIFNSYGWNTNKYIPEDYVRHYGDLSFPAKYLLDNFKDGDVGIVVQAPGINAIQYYLDKRNKFPIKKITPNCGANRYLRYDGKIGPIFGLDYDENPNRFRKLLRAYRRLWLIDLNHIKYFDKNSEIQKWIEENNIKEVEFGGGKIYLFEKRSNEDMQTENLVCSELICFLECPGRAKEVTQVVGFVKTNSSALLR